MKANHHPQDDLLLSYAAGSLSESWSLAMVGYRYSYHGKAAHAAVMPEAGINALNAIVHLFTGIDILRTNRFHFFRYRLFG